jgi:hypothetical protein
MKKYFFLAAAALVTLAACTKVESTVEVPQREISFQVANSLQTKAAGVVYDNGAFGTYAWFNNTNDFMVNEQVDKSGSVWKTVDHTFYWPKTGSISFISYSPFAGTSDTAGTVPTVTKSSITYTGITAGTTDLMYADKATCNANVNEVTDDAAAGTTDSGFSGVPTVFRHALAKLSFDIKANFLEWTDASNGSKTEWEVTVTSAKIGGFKNTGDCALTLNADGKSWDKPVTTVATVNYNVWTNLSGSTSDQELVDATTYPSGVKLTTTAQSLSAASGYVMPQVLEAGAQQLKLTVHIKTKLSNGKYIEEDFTPVIDIKDISSLKAWQMNENIHYTINLKPTASDASNPHNDDPEDVIIRFDPAVADWVNVSTSATIQL